MSSLHKGSENVFSIRDPSVLQLQQPPRGLSETSLTKSLIISCPNIHCPVTLLFPANHKLEIVVGKLGPTDSPTEGQARVGVQVAGQSCSLQGLLYLPSVFLLLGPHRDDRHLKRGQPQWPG